MDLDIIKIASDTTNNKILKDYTHRSKYKNKTCGDTIKMRVNIKKDIKQTQKAWIEIYEKKRL